MVVVSVAVVVSEFSKLSSTSSVGGLLTKKYNYLENNYVKFYS